MEEDFQSAARPLVQQNREEEVVRAEETSVRDEADVETTKVMEEDAAKATAQREAAKAAAKERAKQSRE